MHIEKRGDVEYLLGGVYSDDHPCDEQRDGWWCTIHIDGQHVATMGTDGAEPDEVLVRWPIKFASATPLRSAEEIALEMVSGPIPVDFPNGFCDWSGEIALERVWFLTKDDSFIALDAIRLGVQSAIEQARADGAAAALAGQRPRDLAGRIRALIQEYAGRWADGARLPESRHLRVEACMHAMRWLWHTLRRLEADGAFPEDRITELRRYKGDDVVAQTMRELADELEAIVRECGEEKR